jgi:hypothetical protein
MARTQPTGKQILDGSIQRADLDTTTVGQAVSTKLVQGTGVSLSSTGADAGTGDVTVALAYTTTLPSPSSMTDVGSAGTSNDPAHRDHVHGRERVVTHQKWSAD